MVMVERGQNQPKITAKRLKFEEAVEDEGEDRITALPDCLLLEIISRLRSTKEAIRTGTLSKRWKHLWTSVPTLSFTSIYYDPILQYAQNPNSRSNFVSFVDKTLTQCRQLKLKKFEVYTPYDIRFESQVNNWVRYAISRNVEQLILGFWNMESVEVLIDQFFFLSSCFTDLTFQCCKLNPDGAISWKNLRNLCISLVNLDEDLIENILSGSPLLETLDLNCGGYKRLDITSKSVKNLVISGYMDCEHVYGDEIIKINAPNILSLRIQGNFVLRILLLLNVSSVVEAKLDYYKFAGYSETTPEEAEEEMLKGLILNLHHVKELKIEGFCSEVLSRLKAKGFVFPLNDVMVFQSDSVERGCW